MAGEQYIGVDEQGRARYRTKGGRLLPPSFRPPTRRSPSSRVTDRVSERSRNVIAEAFSGLGGVINSARLAQRPSVGKDLTRPGRTLRDVGGMIRDTSTARDEFMQQGRATYGEFTQEGRYGGEWQGYRDGLDTIGDPNAPFQVRVPGDAEKILKGMDPAVLARLQDRLVAAGYMEGGKFAPGAATDGKTLDAFKSLLTQSNGRGMIWQEALADTERVIKETGVGADDLDERAKFVKPAYVAPDYATLAQTVKSKMEEALGREPDEAELALFTAEMQGWSRENYENMAAGEKAMYDAEGQAMEGVEGEGGAQVQEVDMEARFKESFQSRFKGALAFGRDRADTEAAQELTSGAVSTLSQMSGGLG